MIVRDHGYLLKGNDGRQPDGRVSIPFRFVEGRPGVDDDRVVFDLTRVRGSDQVYVKVEDLHTIIRLSDVEKGTVNEL